MTTISVTFPNILDMSLTLLKLVSPIVAFFGVVFAVSNSISLLKG